MAAAPLIIRAETPRQPIVERLLEELDAYLVALYPAESNHRLSVEELARPEVTFFVARQGDEAVGCGALRIDPAGFGELKRMYVRPAARGAGVGRRLLEAIEDQARRCRLPRLLLETGVHQPEALALYRRAGYAARGPFGAYGPDPLSVFMEKAL